MGRNFSLCRVVTLLIAWYLYPCDSSESFELSKVDTSEAYEIPEVVWLDYIDCAGKYTGIIHADKKSFQLTDSYGRVVFSLSSRDHRVFYFVQMTSPKGVVLLGETGGEGDRSYSAYTFDGQTIFQDIVPRGPLRSSRTGSYFFTVNQCAISVCGPEIYDHNGNLLASLRVGSRRWQLTSMNDSGVVLLQGNKIHKLAVPSMETLVDMTVDSLWEPMDLQTAATSNGQYFAYTERNKLTVCDFNDQSIYVMEIARGFEDAPLKFGVALSPQGQYVFCYESFRPSPSLYIFKKESETYVRLVEDYKMPLEAKVFCAAEKSFANEELCALNFYLRSSSGREFRSFVFDYARASEQEVPGVVVDGLFVESQMGSATYSIYRLNRVLPGSLQTTTVRIGERKDD